MTVNELIENLKDLGPEDREKTVVVEKFPDNAKAYLRIKGTRPEESGGYQDKDYIVLSSASLEPAESDRQLEEDLMRAI